MKHRFLLIQGYQSRSTPDERKGNNEQVSEDLGKRERAMKERTGGAEGRGALILLDVGLGPASKRRKVGERSNAICHKKKKTEDGDSEQEGNRRGGNGATRNIP